MQIKVKLDEGAKMPTKAHDADAGYDLYSRESVDLTENFGEYIFDTGVHMAIPKGYVGLIAGRSGLNFKQSIQCPVSVVDSGYTGSIKVKLYGSEMLNSYEIPAEIHKGDRIAQLLIMPLADAELIQVDALEETDRGDKGFGSSGK